MNRLLFWSPQDKPYKSIEGSKVSQGERDLDGVRQQLQRHMDVLHEFNVYKKKSMFKLIKEHIFLYCMSYIL